MDSCGNFWIFIGNCRIFSTHDPLKFREFTYHSCYKVGLAKVCGP